MNEVNLFHDPLRHDGPDQAPRDLDPCRHVTQPNTMQELRVTIFHDAHGHAVPSVAFHTNFGQRHALCGGQSQSLGQTPRGASHIIQPLMLPLGDVRKQGNPG